ncbi:MAG TPA: response regulator [Cyclobacteriaceae bacterium]|nr:response regulator [Cyclobacteriaceae bacterium]
MKILIVDDDNSKIAHIVSEIHGAYEDLQIETEIDITGAIKRVSQTKFDLLIADLLLPVRAGQSPDEQGGLRLVQEINRNKNLKSPNFIIGVTQYEEARTKFPLMWNVLVYSPSKNEWRDSLKELIHHIVKSSKSKADLDQPHLPTIYVEGKTDAVIFEETLRIFFPELVNRLRIQSEGGANLVIKKLIVWAFTLSRGSNGHYVKAIGLLDGDNASDEAKIEFFKHVNSEHVGHELCKYRFKFAWRIYFQQRYY